MYVEEMSAFWYAVLSLSLPLFAVAGVTGE
jgi:hypothetical protein